MKLLLWEEFRKILERINPLSPPFRPPPLRSKGGFKALPPKAIS